MCLECKDTWTYLRFEWVWINRCSVCGSNLGLIKLGNIILRLNSDTPSLRAEIINVVVSYLSRVHLN